MNVAEIEYTDNTTRAFEYNRISADYPNGIVMFKTVDSELVVFIANTKSIEIYKKGYK